MLGLPAHRNGPVKAKPVQIVKYLGFPMRATSGLIQIVDPQQKRPVSVLSKARSN